jgi:hypothetical protein
MPGAPCAFLFCGYIGSGKGAVPQIIKLSSHNTFMWNPVGTGHGYGFTGREQHGGVLYLHHRLYSLQLPLDAAKCLAYCILAEVADLDNSVGGPIEMVVIKPTGVESFTGFDAYEGKRQQVVDALRALVRPSPG